MNKSDQNQSADSEKVLPLFRRLADHLLLEKEGAPLDLSDDVIEVIDFEDQELKASNLVTPDHFPDQSMYLIDDQIELLKTSLNRLKFYLSELEDIIPH